MKTFSANIRDAFFLFIKQKPVNFFQHGECRFRIFYDEFPSRIEFQLMQEWNGKRTAESAGNFPAEI